MKQHRERLSTELYVKLPKEEVARRAHEAAELRNEYNKVEDEKRLAVKQFTEKLTAIDEDLDRLLHSVRMKAEMQTVDAEMVFDGDEGKCWVEFEGKRYHEREMNTAEYDKGMNPMFIIDMEPVSDRG